MWRIAITLSVIAITLGYFFLQRKYSYWSSRGVPVPPYLPLLGHLHRLSLIGHRWKYIDQIYKKYEDEKFWGMYDGFKPSLHIKDPELIKEIFVKDADHFVDRRPRKFPKNDKIFHEMLNLVKGEEWKSLRSLMSPTFSSGKIKGMFPLVLAIGDDLITKCDKELLKGSSIDMVSVLGEYTMDVVASCGFGIQSNCLLGENSEFSQACKQMVSANITSDSMRFLEAAVKQTIKARKDSGKRRGDFLDIMLDSLEEQKISKQHHKYPMTYDTIISESMLFLLAGFETTANALSFTTHLLAKNPECQTKLRKELQKINENDGGFTYQNIMEAQYLDACFSESLRMYSVAQFLERACTKDYRVPGTDIDLEVSTVVAVTIWSLHYDPKYWTEPKKFDPDRFLPENRQRIVPYTYMPFGHGPRNCIGMRFALLKAKVALAKLCTNFEFSLKPGFEEIVLSLSPNALRPSKNGLPLILKKIK